MPTILLVDDVPQIRDVVETFLTDEGFEVVAVERAEAALAHLDVSLPDLLILDGRLPGMSGWECLEVLRAREQTIGLPVLMLTAAPEDGQRYQGMTEDQCTTYLGKPFDLDTLLESIYDVIETCNQRMVPA